MIDLKEVEDGHELYIQYKGECMSCSMNTTTTLAGMQDMLNFKLKSNLRVMVV